MTTQSIVVNGQRTQVPAGTCCVSDLKESLGISPLAEFFRVAGQGLQPLADDVRLNIDSEISFFTCMPEVKP